MSSTSQSAKPYASAIDQSARSSASASDSSPSVAASVSKSRQRSAARRSSAADGARPDSTSASRTSSAGILSSLSTRTHVAAKRSSGTPSRDSSSDSTLRVDTLTPTSEAERPTRFMKPTAAERSSASATVSGTPQMSMFHWKCSRRRPRVVRSYRQHCGIENHLMVVGSALRRPSTIRASDGVISGRSVTRRPPLSSKL
mmetsp:Transcript_7051/g.20547  ORF Transcript_7051/g.20547 Transcript_7051/m.20547 type:complete len:200 (-) Transcript_7051:232-831(-)